MNGANLLSYLMPVLTVLVSVGVGAIISGKSWNRQRQWELRRDAVLDAIRALADLEAAVVNLNSCLSGYLSVSQKGLTDKINAEVNVAAQCFRNSRTSYMRAYRIADMAVGGQFSKAMSTYFLLTGTVSKDMRSQKSFLDRAKMEKLALAGKDVILSARQALGIKDAGDLPQFDDLN